MVPLIKLCIKLKIVCIPLMIISAIAIYFFGLGAQEIIGISINNIFFYSTWIALISSVFENVIFKPVFYHLTGKIAKENAQRFHAEDLSEDDLSLELLFIENISASSKISHITAAIIGIIVYFVLGPTLGTPIVEWAALAIFLLGPIAIAAINQSGLNTMREKSPELYKEATNWVRATDNVYFN